jgi:Zn-dependent M28 family amino/carboxypeptidase
MKRWTFSAAVLATIVLIAANLRAADPRDGSRWWSHVLFLADDSLEGRATGSAGHRKAAEYVAAEFQKLGLKPAGTRGYFQPVALTSRTIDEPKCSLELVRGGDTQPLVLGKDAVISLRVDPAPEVEAELVFAGHGIANPEIGYDDFKGLDVSGKVVVFLAGAPTTIPGPLAAHMQSASERNGLLARLGAIGAIYIPNPKSMDIPWDRSALARFLPAMSLADPALDDSHGLKFGAMMNPASADKLFAGTGHTIKEILDAANADKPLPRFSIPAKVKAKVGISRAELVSDNVVGLLEGSDPVLKDEFVVFTAHLDHLGIGKPIKGDSINNGAMDNASGIAAMLDVAARLKEQGVKLKRSVLFVAVTAEEKGLLGSRFFANHPTVDAKQIVANINTDMFLPLFPLKLLTVYGLDESDLGPDAAVVAKEMGIEAQPDPEPKRNAFIRSDQYSFIRQGVPALALKVGFSKGSAEEATSKKWLTERYHAPSDDVAQPVDKKAAADFDGVVAKLVERIANRESRPRWRDTSFFKRYASSKP